MDTTSIVVDTPEADVSTDPTPGPARPERPGPGPAGAVHWLIAALSVGAGVIHLAMVTPHAQESLGMGLAFAAAGWLQIALGVAVVARPSRLLVQLAIAGNVVFIAAWAWSRTVGLPAWTGAGGVEPASAVDLFCVVLEAGVVLGALVLLVVAPDRLRARGRPVAVASGVAVVGVLLATTAVLAAPSTADHVHAGTGEDGAGVHGAGDHAAGDHAVGDHGNEAAAPGAAAHGDHRAEPGAPAPAAGHAGHHGAESDIRYEQLPPATRTEVDQVIAKWATAYPTGADAKAAGWSKATPNLYGIGSHYIKGAQGLSVAVPFDLLNPNILLYDGEGPDARFAGVSYVVKGEAEGFTGDFDFFHEHATACIENGKISLTEESSTFWYSDSECTAVGGKVIPIAGDRMIHLWIGPGYRDAPIFAHDNPEIYDGYYPKRTS